jgi:hypothetical protein
MDGDKKQAPHNTIRTFKDDIVSSGGALDDHGVVFENEHKEEQNEPATEKQPKQQAESSHKTNSILSNKDDVFDVSRAFTDKHEAGTIITDKRRRRPSFGSMFVQALTEWVDSAKEKTDNRVLTKKETGGTKVAPARTRKDTIVRATKDAVRPPEDDHKVVLEKIRTLDTDATRITGKPYLIKEKPKTAPSWTHTKDEQNHAAQHHQTKPALTPEHNESLVAPRIKDHSSPESFKQKASPVPAREGTETEPIEVKRENLVSSDSERVTAPLPQHHSTPNEQRKKEKAEQKPKKKKRSWWRFLFLDLGRVHGTGSDEAPVEEVPREETVHKEIKSSAVASPETEKTSVSPVFHSTAPDTRNAPPETPRQPNHSLPKGTPAAEPRDALSFAQYPTKQAPAPRKPKSTPPRSRLFVWVTVVVLAAVGGVGASYYLLVAKPDTGTAIIKQSGPSSTFLTTDASAPVSLVRDRAVFLTSLTDAVKNATPGIVQIYPTITTGTTADGSSDKRMATTADIFDVLSPQAPSAFIRSLGQNMILGSVTVSENEPFIILKTSVFDVAFAGMLDWEKTMSADLSPLFGVPVSRTYNVNARTADNSYDAHFKDIVVQNHGARILYDSENRERIAYAFADKQTIIITTKAAALAKLLDALR